MLKKWMFFPDLNCCCIQSFWKISFGCQSCSVEKYRAKAVFVLNRYKIICHKWYDLSSFSCFVCHCRCGPVTFCQMSRLYRTAAREITIKSMENRCCWSMRGKKLRERCGMHTHNHSIFTEPLSKIFLT